MIRKYEIMYIIDQDTQDVKAVQKKLNDTLTVNGGKIVASEDWGLKNFAYEIKHKAKGYYCVVIAETDGANINEFQRIAGIDKNVVRTMVINTESEKRYEQSTKMSKTDMSQFKEEKRPARGFDKRKPARNFNDKPSEEKATAPAAEKPAKEANEVKEDK